MSENKSEKKKVFNIIRIICFLIILGTGTAMLLFGVYENKAYSELEKRELAEIPSLSVDSVISGEYEAGLEEALSDHMYGRDGFVTAKTYARVLMGARMIDNIYIDGSRLIEVYKDEDFDDSQIVDNISKLAGFAAMAAHGAGAEHVKIMLVPGKSDIYADRLPEYVMQSGKPAGIADMLRKELEEKLLEEVVHIELNGGDSGSVFEGTVDAGANDGADEDSDDDSEEDDESLKELEEEFGFDFEEGDPDEEGDDFDEDEEEEDVEISSGESEENSDIENNLDAETDSSDEFLVVDEGSSAGNPDADADSDVEVESVYFDTRTIEKNAHDMVIDLTDTFSAHKDEYIYYMTDHHWTSLGAKYAYMKYMNISDVQTSYATVSEDFLGTDYNRIHYYKKYDVIDRYNISEAETATMQINDSGDVRQFDHIYDDDALKTRDKYNYFLRGNYSQITIKTNAGSGKTLLIIKDSFANSMIPFLCAEYEKIIIVDPRYINSGVLNNINDEKPDDILILYNTEKFMQDTHQMYLE